MSHRVICPAAPVSTAINPCGGEWFPWIVCTPSDNVKPMGLMDVKGVFGASGPANVNITVTKSLVV
jgi:hypothetical protein